MTVLGLDMLRLAVQGVLVLEIGWGEELHRFTSQMNADTAIFWVISCVASSEKDQNKMSMEISSRKMLLLGDQSSL